MSAKLCQGKKKKNSPFFFSLKKVCVASAQKLWSLLLSIWAIVQSTKLHKINTLEYMYFYFLYLCVQHIYIKYVWTAWVCSILTILLHLGNDLFILIFLLVRIIGIAQRPTCYFLWEYKHNAIRFIFWWSLLYDKKKIIIKKNHFVEAFYHFAYANWEKPILLWHSLVEAKKPGLQGFYIYFTNFWEIWNVICNERSNLPLVNWSANRTFQRVSGMFFKSEKHKSLNGKELICL